MEPDEGGAACLVLALCGLPGAGKSTLVQRFVSEAPAVVSAEVHCVSFDDVFLEADEPTSSPQVGTVEHQRTLGFEAEKWRQSRERALNEVDRLVSVALAGRRGNSSTSKKCRHLIVVDDNMYYRSMRHQCYLIAKKYEVPYGQVYVKVPLQLALLRNGQRSGPARVPSQVIERMHARFEEPQPAEHSWERHTFVLHQQHAQDEANSDERLLSLWRAIEAMFADDFVREEALRERERQQRSDADREQCLASLLHRLDQQLRSQVALILASTPDRPKEAGKVVAALKRDFLTKARGRDDVLALLARTHKSGSDNHHGEEEELLQRLCGTFKEACLKVLASSHQGS